MGWVCSLDGIYGKCIQIIGQEASWMTKEEMEVNTEVDVWETGCEDGRLKWLRII